MKLPDPDSLRRNAQELRRQELARIAHAAALKWTTFRKAVHAPHPCQSPTPSHP